MILIIGGSGFVGTNLLKVIDADCINFDKNKSEYFNDITTLGNIVNLNELEGVFQNITHVVLLAAEHKDNVSPVSLYYDVNVEGTKNVLKLMEKFNVNNLIFTSSVAVYGLNKINPTEQSEVDPFNHYGISKYKAEEQIVSWYKKNPKKRSATIIRPTVIFGINNRGNVYNLFKQIYNGRFFMISDGKNKKSMAYVENVAFFIKSILKNSLPGFNIFNYSDKPDLNMNELVSFFKDELKIKTFNFKIPYFVGVSAGLILDFISKLTNIKFSVSYVRIKKFCATTQYDSSKMTKNFNPPFSIFDGLKKTIEHEFKKK